MLVSYPDVLSPGGGLAAWQRTGGLWWWRPGSGLVARGWAARGRHPLN